MNRECWAERLSSMNLAELEVEKERLRKLVLTYDCWGPIETINTERYYDVLKTIEDFDAVVSGEEQ